MPCNLSRDIRCILAILGQPSPGDPVSVRSRADALRACLRGLDYSSLIAIAALAFAGRDGVSPEPLAVRLRECALFDSAQLMELLVSRHTALASYLKAGLVLRGSCPEQETRHPARSVTRGKHYQQRTA